MKKISIIIACLMVGLAFAGDPPPVKKEKPKQVEVLKVMPKKVDPNEKEEPYVEPNDGWILKVQVIKPKKKD
jgi:hypothetical protein